MMQRPARTVITILLVLASFVVGLVVGTGQHEQEVVAPVAPTSRIDDPGATTERRHVSQAVAVQAPDPASDESVTTDASVPSVATGEFVPQHLDVQVLNADGSACDNVLVYALAEGAPGADDDSRLPHAETDESGRCRLVLNAPGVCDIGAVGLTFRHTLAESVAVPGTEPLTLVMPAATTVVIDAVDVHVPRLTVDSAAERAAAFPGRGQAVQAGYFYTPREGRFTVLAPAGTELVIGPLRGIVAVPNRLRAPGRVTLKRAPIMQARLAFEPEERTWAHPVEIEVVFDWGPGSSWHDRERYHFDLPADTPLADHPERHVTPTATVPTRRGTVRWSGPHIEDGEADWDSDESKFVAVVIDVRDVPDATLHRRRARVLDPERLARDDVTLGAVTKEQEFGAQWDLDDVAIGEAADVARNMKWILATAGDSVIAGPVPALDGRAETTLTLRRGGWLIVMPTRVTDDASGRTRVRRTDGAPLAFTDDAGEREFQFEAEIYAGQRLGPFEPGDLELVLEPPAPSHSTTLRVRVEAGSFRPLHIPAAPAR